MTKKVLAAAKRFSKIYGLDGKDVGKRVGMTLEQARRLQDEFFKTFPALKTFKKEK